MIVTITSFSYKRGLPEEKMAIGNIGIGNIYHVRLPGDAEPALGRIAERKGLVHREMV